MTSATAGLTRCDARMVLAPFLMRYLTVISTERILVSSVTCRLSSKGTFRSTLTNTFLPLRSASLRLARGRLPDVGIV